MKNQTTVPTLTHQVQLYRFKFSEDVTNIHRFTGLLAKYSSACACVHACGCGCECGCVWGGGGGRGYSPCPAEPQQLHSNFTAAAMPLAQLCCLMTELCRDARLPKIPGTLVSRLKLWGLGDGGSDNGDSLFPTPVLFFWKPSHLTHIPQLPPCKLTSQLNILEFLEHLWPSNTSKFYCTNIPVGRVIQESTSPNKQKSDWSSTSKEQLSKPSDKKVMTPWWDITIFTNFPLLKYFLIILLAI